MKLVVGISLGSGEQNFEFHTSFLGQPFHVRRIGTGGSTAQAVKLLKLYEPHAHAIGLGVVRDRYTVGSRGYVEKDSARLTGVVQHVPVTTGGQIGRAHV